MTVVSWLCVRQKRDVDPDYERGIDDVFNQYERHVSARIASGDQVAGVLTLEIAWVYLLFVLELGSVCTRDHLQSRSIENSTVVSRQSGATTDE